MVKQILAYIYVLTMNSEFISTILTPIETKINVEYEKNIKVS